MSRKTWYRFWFETDRGARDHKWFLLEAGLPYERLRALAEDWAMTYGAFRNAAHPVRFGHAEGTPTEAEFEEMIREARTQVENWNLRLEELFDKRDEARTAVTDPGIGRAP